MTLSPNDTSLFYFLSTVAQAFAGGFAILAAFAVFRLSALRLSRERSLDMICQRAMKLSEPAALEIVPELKGPIVPILKKLDDRDVGGIEGVMGRLSSVGFDDSEEQLRLKRFRDDLLYQFACILQGFQTEDGLRKRVKLGCKLTVGVVGCSLVALPFARTTATMASARWLLFGGILLLCGLTLHSLYRIAVDSIGGGDAEPSAKPPPKEETRTPVAATPPANKPADDTASGEAE